MTVKSMKPWINIFLERPYRQSFGLDFIILRPSATYGFGMRWPIFIKPMVENSVRGLPVRFETGSEVPRDYTPT